MTRVRRPPSQPGIPGWLSRAGRFYSHVAKLALSTFLLFVLANVVAAVFMAVHERYWAPSPGSLRYGLDRLSPLYPGMTEAEIEQLLGETWSRNYVYAPLVQHREAAAEGRFVNVDQAGFRRSAAQGPWPPDPAALNVFVYGGSTTFGYGVSDEQTIPSRLQEELAGMGCWAQVAVYNFGRGNYYSDQERSLFESHLTAGLRPDVAIFVDGLNEWKEAPKFTDRLDYLLRESQAGLIARAVKGLPLVDLIRLIRGTAQPPGEGSGADPRLDGERYLDRWLRNKRLISAAAREFGVSPLFVWQPTPAYGYHMELHPFAAETEAVFDAPGRRASSHAYGLLDGMRAEHPDLEPAGDFLWIADLQRDRAQPLYVDAVHYTAAFCREIAQSVATFVGGRLRCASGGQLVDP